MNIEDKNFYMSIWHTRKHNCEICGKKLGNEPMSYMFEHLLEKESYPKLRHNAQNIILICLEDHQCKNRGFPKPKHKEFIEKAKEELL